MPDPALTALHDQANMACRQELAHLADTYRLLAARVGDAQYGPPDSDQSEPEPGGATSAWDHDYGV